MSELNWIQVAASLLGGGAAGAVITILVTAFRSRRQPVGFRIDVLPVFRRAVHDARFSPSVTVSDGDATLHFDNLFLASIDLVNRGNRDKAAFPVGFTLAQGDAAILAECSTPDRHHAATVAIAPTPAKARQDVDYNLSPFNRGDLYRVKLYVYTSGGDPGEIRVGSPEPVLFKPLPTLGELAVAAARSVKVKFGPVSITLSDK